MKTFAVPLADLERGPKHVVWSIEPKWLDTVLKGSEARPQGTAGVADVTLSKDGRQVIIRGRVQVILTMPCARTLDPVDVDIDAELLLMLTPAPSIIANPKRSKKRGASGAGNGSSPMKGSDDTGRLAKDRFLSVEDAAQDHYSGEEIVLDEYIRESILLELPMVPLRSDLRDIDNPAIPRPPEEANNGTGNRIDPRLAPLAELVGRLKHDTKE